MYSRVWKEVQMTALWIFKKKTCPGRRLANTGTASGLYDGPASLKLSQLCPTIYFGLTHIHPDENVKLFSSYRHRDMFTFRDWHHRFIAPNITDNGRELLILTSRTSPAARRMGTNGFLMLKNDSVHLQTNLHSKWYYAKAVRQ
ncbi:hypothetical protein GWI33_003473 [Rhynchophorus ferrugineus]|uniref:Uncharacterized protein n=1 Tax=Rhynchophorus ferrugineus TaxID=354439 RepID=A0A834MH57_RHYFE|nr:hypothetical protein GWI33_003473 [Rhynchophorus ferrugineus]